MSAETQGRWAGRNTGKDETRNAVWRLLEEADVAIGPAVSRIPNFVGADMASWRLAHTEAWQKAATIKCNPDPPQYPLRLRALYEGRVLYCPVPELVENAAYVRIDPEKLVAANVSFELAATHQGYMRYGELISFEEVPPLDLCVFGSVAVTRAGGRTGKGAGFADLEAGIFFDLGLIGPHTVMATTVHSLQIVPDDRIVMLPHDSPMHLIATEAELTVTGSRAQRTIGVNWNEVQPDQYLSMPFLNELRRKLAPQTGGAGDIPLARGPTIKNGRNGA